MQWFQTMKCEDRKRAISDYPIQRNLPMYPAGLHKYETTNDRYHRLIRNYQIDVDYVFYSGRRYQRYIRLFKVIPIPNCDDDDNNDHQSDDIDDDNDYAKMIKKYAPDEVPSKKAKYDDAATKDYMNGLDKAAAELKYTPRFCPRLDNPDPTLFYCKPEDRPQDEVFVSVEPNHYIAIVDRPAPYPLGIHEFNIEPVSHVYINFKERLFVYARNETTDVEVSSDSYSFKGGN